VNTLEEFTIKRVSILKSLLSLGSLSEQPRGWRNSLESNERALTQGCVECTARLGWHRAVRNGNVCERAMAPYFYNPK